ncbi:helix-turn-helix domain-containing protein [Streptomyces pratensis]|nr:helix-turn-helix domain-containing protein [Streptomyces pratensis]
MTVRDPCGTTDHEVRAAGWVPVEQEKRERLRLEAAERFERGDDAAVIAADLRVTERTVRRWRNIWRDGGIAALKSKGAGVAGTAVGPGVGESGGGAETGSAGPRLTDDSGGRWARIKALIGRLFHKSYTIQGVAKLLSKCGRTRCGE